MADSYLALDRLIMMIFYFSTLAKSPDFNAKTNEILGGGKHLAVISFASSASTMIQITV